MPSAGEAVKPYYWADDNDKEMLRIYDAINELSANSGRPGPLTLPPVM